jgi:hypothetical protein
MTPEEKKKLLKNIKTGCAGMRSSICGVSFTAERSKEALKSAEWLVTELVARTLGISKAGLRMRALKK